VLPPITIETLQNLALALHKGLANTAAGLKAQIKIANPNKIPQLIHKKPTLIKIPSALTKIKLDLILETNVQQNKIKNLILLKFNTLFY
jgi:hypothetical protein